jgi:hypothetical protein
MRNLTSHCELEGSTVKTVISVTTRLVVDFSGMRSAPCPPGHRSPYHVRWKAAGWSAGREGCMQMPVMYTDDPPLSSGGLHPGILVRAYRNQATSSPSFFARKPVHPDCSMIASDLRTIERVNATARDASRAAYASTKSSLLLSLCST